MAAGSLELARTATNRRSISGTKSEVRAPETVGMVGADGDLEAPTLNFLNSFDVVVVDEQIAERAVGLRRGRRIKLPDAVIWATAQAHAMLLVTRNTKDFPEDDPGVRAPYRL